MTSAKSGRALRVAELFAGVGGFRLGFENASRGFNTVFSSQWEPPGTPGRQFASYCYSDKRRFGNSGHVNEDIEVVLSRFAKHPSALPEIDVVVGGFPCQDYSVAKPLRLADGIVGKKGVLWWQIYRLLGMLSRRKRPARWVVLENVDRLLKSPSQQKGRDFAVMLRCLTKLGYDVEWRIVNAADYGYPQRRRRVFIVATLNSGTVRDGITRILRSGVLARAFPVELASGGEHIEAPAINLSGSIQRISSEFGRGVERSQFLNSGFATGARFFTLGTEPSYDGPCTSLGDILLPDSEIGEDLLIPQADVGRWVKLKSGKREPRVHRASGFHYLYSEGPMMFPDSKKRPARTILTSEGGKSPSRTKHVVEMESGQLRRLHPIELERLNGFPDDWTHSGMTANQRAFCMGNALVVGVVERIARVIALREGLPVRRQNRTANLSK
jgi:DNA (cytosine-5)-methyltransferase 1